MVDKPRTLAFVILAAVAWIAPQTARADDPPDLFLENLADFVWTGTGGNSTWENSPNWTAPTFPGGYPYTIPTYPNDPGRVDTSAVDIFPVVGANLSGALNADRTVNIAGSDVTVASIKLGGTGVAVTTNVTASPNPSLTTGTFRLVFENQEWNDNLTNPGDQNADPKIEPEPIWSFNQGRSLIWSTGTAGAGKENRLTADIQLNDDVDVEGDRDLHIYGTIYEGPSEDIPTDPTPTMPSPMGAPAASLSSLLPAGNTLFIHGEMRTVRDETSPGMNAPIEDDRGLSLNATRGIVLPEDPQNPPNSADEVGRQGIVDVIGTFVGNGAVYIGSPNGNTLPLGTVILRGDSRNIPGVGSPDTSEGAPEGAVIDNDPYDAVDPYYDGRVIMNRGNLVLANDGALGEADLKTGNPTQGFGFNIISTDDNRKIANEIQVAQWQTVRGATSVPGIESLGDHSIEFSGIVSQENTRGWINLLPAGKTLTFSGPTYPSDKAENPPGQGRAITYDGSGKTIISGGIHDQLVTGDEDPNILDKIGYVRVRGTGTVVIDGRVFDDMGAQTGFNVADYTGYTFVEGSNLHFHSTNDLPGGTVVSRGGGVGVDEGVRTNSSFLAKLNNSNNPNWDPNTSPFFATWGDTAPVYTGYATGGLMLGTVGGNEYTQDLDFTSGDLANAANMTLAAQEGGSTYSGTITPSSTIKVNPDTYQLGGGSGVLTLPNANQLTGARNLLVTNGGEVKLTATNNYTGTTRILRKYLPSNQGQAEASQRLSGGNNDGTTTGAVTTTLTATTLANGGAASSIGSSSNAASNLVIQGSTLKYEGAATSTDRLFTVGTSGATLDASGTGAVSFTNPGALAIAVPARRSGLIAPVVPGDNNNTVFGQPAHPTASRQVFQTDDLALGMRVYTPQGDFTPPEGGSPVRITAIQNREVMQAGQPNPLSSESDNDGTTLPNAWPGYTATAVRTAIQFGPAPARFLTLTGANTGNNTLAPLIGDAPPADIDAAATTPEVAAAEAAAGYGTVGIQQAGTGKWILTGNNTYTGATNVEAGTLLINGNQTGGGTATVSAGATLGGNGSLPGALINNGVVAPGTSTGTLTVNGNYVQSAGAKLAIEIGGTAAGAFDLLRVVQGVDTGSIAGDYNEDGTVNAADYTVWRDHLGQTFDLPNEGDDVSTGMVDQDDYDFWKENFGDANLSLGIASITGTIDIDLINGFVPSVGNMFTILTAPEGLNAGSLALAGESSGFNLIVNPTSLVLSYTGSWRRQPRWRVRPRAGQLPVSRPRPVRSCLRPAAGKLTCLRSIKTRIDFFCRELVRCLESNCTWLSRRLPPRVSCRRVPRRWTILIGSRD